MKIASTGVVIVALLSAGGCMRGQKQANSPEGGSATGAEAGVPTATTRPESGQPLDNIERADRLLGEQVLTVDHLHSGKIDDFVIDQDSGRILYAVVGIGGVLGIGETRVAVPPALFIEAKNGTVQIDVDKTKLTRAPQVPSDVEKRPTADFLGKAYGYFGQQAWWQGPATAAASFNSARTASELQGMSVQNHAGQDIGKVQNVVLDVPAGKEVYLVISPSSDMSLGNNLYALPPGVVKFSTDQKTLVADITREKLGNAPHFANEDWSELSNTAWAQKVYQYYGQAGALPNGALQPTGRAK